jgi:thymidylate kinase
MEGEVLLIVKFTGGFSKMLVHNVGELEHPGFIVFEGLDFTGKTFAAKRVAETLVGDKRFRLNAKYHHGKGFLDSEIVSPEYLKTLKPLERVNYLLTCYSRDNLPRNPGEFSEIFQDRYFPYTLFYALTNTNMNLDDLASKTRELRRPKHIFLFECDYKERIRRSQARKIKPNELESLYSIGNHERFTKLYRDIVNAIEVPYTIINTTPLENEQVVEYISSRLEDKRILVHDINLEDLSEANEYDLFKSTAEFKLNALKGGRCFSPIQVLRKISGKRYVSLVEDGRHRAYASLKAERKTIPAYVNYESSSDLELEKLRSIGDFTFREDDNGRVIDGRVVY